MRVRKAFLLCHFTALAFLASCGGKTDRIIAVSEKQHQAVQPEKIKESIDDIVPEKRFLVAFKGYRSAFDYQLHLVSSSARQGVAKRLGHYGTQFLEIAPAGDPGALWALVEQQGKKSIGKFLVQTDFFNPLLSDLKDVSSLQVSVDFSKLGFVERDGFGKQTLRVYFFQTGETRKILSEEAENILSYRFLPDSEAVLLAKKSENHVFYVEISLRKETFGEFATVLDKHDAHLSPPVFLGTSEGMWCFVEQRQNRSTLKLWDRKTREEVSLFEANEIYDPSLSPDGRFLAFWAQSDQGQAVWLYDLLLRRAEVVAHLSIPVEGELYYRPERVHPVWTPDGDQIVYGNFDGWHGLIYAYLISEKRIHQLTDNIFIDFYYPILLGEGKK